MAKKWNKSTTENTQQMNCLQQNRQSYQTLETQYLLFVQMISFEQNNSNLDIWQIDSSQRHLVKF